MIYLFDKDEKLIKIVRKSAVKTALQKYALTTERYVSDRLTVELKGLNADELEQVEYMAIQTMEDAHTFHYFYVAQKFSDSLTTLIGVQSGIEELRKSPVYDKRPKNAFARDVITDLLAGTNWQARFVGETAPHSTNFYYTSVFDALKKVCVVWDLEMQFFVEMNGNRIGARYIDFKQKIGQAVGKRVVYGHNALQILQEVERTNIFTALVGRGKGEETGDGYGRKITFENVVWSRTQGKPVDKPKGQKYLELPLMTRQYGIKNADGSMRPKIGFVDFSEEENPEVLIERTYRALIDAARPQLTLKTSSVYLRGVKIGDTIRVVRHDKKLDYDTRIFEITFNRLNNQSSDIKLGDRIGESNEAKVQTIADKAVERFVNNEFSSFVQNLPDYLPSADGFNNNWYGAEDPTVKYPGKVLINDIWYKPDPEHEGHKIMLRWTGEVWEEILRTYDSEALRDRIAEEVAKVNETMQANEVERQRQIDDLLLKAGANKSLAEEAKKIGDQAKLEAADALSKALQYKNEAIAEATRLDTVERQATETKLATAKSQAVAEATRLVETAKSLLSGQISNVSTDLSQTKETIKLLATRATVEALTGRISSAESTLQVQAGEIASRVKSSDFDQAKQRISTAESSITQLENRITTEISEIEVGGRNYFLNSDFSISSGNKGIAVHPDFMEHARGRKFIISVEVEGQNVVSQNQGRFGLSSSFAKGNTTARDWIEVWEKGIGNIPKKRIYQVFEFKDEWSDFRAALFVQTGGEVTVGFPKLEIGSLVTDYSKAPEDFIADITTTKTLITQTAEGQQQLSTRLTETQGKVTTAETNIRQLVNDVSSKVSQTNFDNLKKIVDSQATTISQNQTAIALKAEKTYVDGVKTTADSAKSTANDALLKANANADAIKTTQAELKVTSDAVKTKVSSTDFDATKKRLEIAETTIVTQAGEIEKRLTSTQVETAISNKGYQTKSDVDSNITGRGYITNSALQPYALSTTVQNLVKETSDSFSRTISETRALIPTSAGGRNYLLNSKTEISGGWSTKAISLSRELLDNLNGIKTVTISCDVEGINVSALNSRKRFGLACSVEINGVVNYWEVWQTEDTAKKRISQTFTVPEGKSITKFYSPTLWIQAEGNVKVSNPKLEFGVLPTDWSPAPEDHVTVTAFNTVIDTVNSHTRTLSEQGSSISQAVQTAQGLITRVENLSVGGRNYFLKSDFSISSGNKAIAIHPDFMKHAKGKKFVVSVEVEGKNVVFADRGRFGISTSGQRPGLTWKDWLEVWETGTGNIPKKRIYQVFSYIDDWMDFGANLYVQTGGETIVGYPKLEIGTMPTDWSPAPEDSDTAIQAVSTQVSTLAGSWAVKNLTNSGTVLNQLNLNKDGSVKIDGSLVQITGKTYIQDGVITSAKIAGLDAGKITTGTLDAARIKANSIDGSKLVFDQAFVNKMTANEALFKQLFAKNAFITSVQAVTLSASQITGGLMRATNGAMEIDFNNSTIDMFKDGAIRFHSGSNAIYRQSADGIHTGFVHFGTTSKGGIYASLGSTSSRDGINSKSSGRFAGIRVARTSERSDSHVASQDAVELYGDTIFFGHGFEGGGFSMHTTLTGGRTISLNKIHDAIINLCRCWIHLRNVGFNPNDAAFKKALDVELGQAQQLYNEIARIT
ncbi:TPA: phage tail protein [Streptococcus suis]|nr:phage tail protein [Streptococcus suis]